MNVPNALSTRKDLRAIIDAYDRFLEMKVITSPDRMKAGNALAAKDLVRTIGVSEVNKGRISRLSGKQKAAKKETPESAASFGTRESPLIDELSNTGIVAQSDTDQVIDTAQREALFRELKDCIPCNTKFALGDFDFDRLKEIFALDLAARFRFLDDFARLFEGNALLDELCLLLQLFKNLCPGDLLVLIALLLSFVNKTLLDIRFNLVSILQDLLASILRPYIGGLEDFLTALIQGILDQIECILNVIETTARQLKNLNLTIGDPIQPPPPDEDARRRAFQRAQGFPNVPDPDGGAPPFRSRGRPAPVNFKVEFTGEGTDEVLDDVIVGAARTRQGISIGVKKTTTFFSRTIPEKITSLLQGGSDYLQEELTKIQDTVIDLFQTEWLVTRENLTFYEQLQAATTLVNLIQIIVKLGKGEDLCEEDNIRTLMDELNNVSPVPVIIEDETFPGGGATADPDSPTGARRRAPVSESSDAANPKAIRFSLKKCLKGPTPAEEVMIRQWVSQLTG